MNPDLVLLDNLFQQHAQQKSVFFRRIMQIEESIRQTNEFLECAEQFAQSDTDPGLSLSNQLYAPDNYSFANLCQPPATLLSAAGSQPATSSVSSRTLHQLPPPSPHSSPRHLSSLAAGACLSLEQIVAMSDPNTASSTIADCLKEAEGALQQAEEGTSTREVYFKTAERALERAYILMQELKMGSTSSDLPSNFKEREGSSMDPMAQEIFPLPSSDRSDCKLTPDLIASLKSTADALSPPGDRRNIFQSSFGSKVSSHPTMLPLETKRQHSHSDYMSPVLGHPSLELDGDSGGSSPYRMIETQSPRNSPYRMRELQTPSPLNSPYRMRDTQTPSPQNSPHRMHDTETPSPPTPGRDSPSFPGYFFPPSFRTKMSSPDLPQSHLPAGSPHAQLNFHIQMPSGFVLPRQRGPRRKGGRFQCLYPGCNKTYTAKFSLKRHEKKHTGEKLFTCQQEDHAPQTQPHGESKKEDEVPKGTCGKAFPEKWRLKRHQRRSSELQPKDSTEPD